MYENGEIAEELDQNEYVSVINQQSIEQLDKMHLEFYTNFKTFKDSLEAKEETNFKYLRCRLDFNLYYQMKQMQEVGMDDDDQDMDDEYGGQDGGYGSQGDEEEDIGVGGSDDDDDDVGE